VTGYSRRVTGDIAGYLTDNFRVNAGNYLTLANMAGKLLQQFKVGKAQPYRFNPAKNLVPTGLKTSLDLFKKSSSGPTNCTAY